MADHGRSIVCAGPESLARCLLAGRSEEARAELAASPGAALRDIAAAARRLGDFWAEDDCDFFDVARAAGCLGDLLREMGPDQELAPAAHAPAIIVTLAPGENHALGADIVARVFHVAGWRAARCAADGLPDALASEWFDVVGFSLGCERYAAALPSAIAAARAASRNRRLAVIVGGAAIAAAPGLGAALGADSSFAACDIAVHFPHSLLRALRL
jgi:methanogenic corrinoid protein MtbC1